MVNPSVPDDLNYFQLIGALSHLFQKNSSELDFRVVAVFACFVAEMRAFHAAKTAFILLSRAFYA